MQRRTLLQLQQMAKSAYQATLGHGIVDAVGAVLARHTLHTTTATRQTTWKAEDEKAVADIHKALQTFNRNVLRAREQRTAEPATPDAERRIYFDKYITDAEARAGLESGRYVSGRLRINRKKRTEAYVTVAHGSHDYIVPTERARNRALDGDLVVLEVTGSQTISDDKRSSDEKEDESDEDSSPAPQLRQKAKVVRILERRPLHAVPGVVRHPAWSWGRPAQVPKGQVARYGLFIPSDPRYPFMRVSIEHFCRLVGGTRESGAFAVARVLEEHENTIISAEMDLNWTETERSPRGILRQRLGVVGDIETETRVIFSEFDVDDSEFPESALTILPAIPWRPSAQDLEGRRDFRDEIVYTIDPETARDLDDAVSCKELEDGTLEIGVHIADVSHFVPENSEVDEIARRRATTVYMVQRAIPMLPRVLCEELCSLNPGVDRLTFSVVWRMDRQGREVGPRWFGRSVIRPCTRFSYGQAQDLLDGKSFSEATGVSSKAGITGNFTESQVLKSLQQMLAISKRLTAQRVAAGALDIRSYQLKFELDELNQPRQASVYVWRDTNRLIQEFMLLANVAVAEKLTETLPQLALLRRHPPPKLRPLKAFVQYAESLGVTIDATSSRSLQQSFTRLNEAAEENEALLILQNNAVKSMNRAEYFCTGTSPDPATWRHYALAMSHYTHFTSPIRRYADVVVHRLLQQALTHSSTNITSEQCELWAKTCNLRKENARLAQERSSMVYLAAYVEEERRRSGRMGSDEGLEADAYVVEVNDRSIDVAIPCFGLERRIMLDHALGVRRTRLERDPETGRRELAIEFCSARERRSAAGKETRGDNGGSSVATVLGARAAKIAGPGDSLSPHLRLQVFKPVRVWLQGDFSSSPCDVVAGLVWMPKPQEATAQASRAEPTQKP